MKYVILRCDDEVAEELYVTGLRGGTELPLTFDFGGDNMFEGHIIAVVEKVF